MSKFAPPRETTKILYCSPSKFLGECVEKTLHQTFKVKDGDYSKFLQVPLWKGDGKGCAQGVGPYVVAARAVPLPLSAGWKINNQTIKRKPKGKGEKGKGKAVIKAGKKLQKGNLHDFFGNKK
jgi:hypothetical protein